ncbi:hypothetical protein GCM10027614_70570 [Micromonospora vulcania]
MELGALLTEVAARYPSPPVRVVPPSGPLWTAGNADELRRVLANLVDNAVRHAHGAVLLAAETPPLAAVQNAADVGSGLAAYHLVTVTDDGPGIPVADRDRVFGRFTRLDDGRARDDGGAGLGLAIVRELVRRAGGVITLTDTPAGSGLRVCLLLPVLPTDESQEPPTDAP